MQFRHVEPARIEREWPVFAEMLWPAVRHDPNVRMQDVFDKLVSGQLSMVEALGDEASGIMAFEVLEMGDALVCWASYLAGSVAGGPRQMVRTMRALMAQLETVASAAGCTEIRIGGRDWSRVFPDFERFDDVPNRLRKAL